MSNQGGGRGAFQNTVNVSRETLERLDVYAALLEKWNPAINLVAPSTIPSLWHRHFLDSAQIVKIAPKNTTTWADLGTGGGFPGLIVAILSAEANPNLRMTCIESDQRKATFLRAVVRETGLNASIITQRIGNVNPLGSEVISARALASLDDLLDLAERHLAPSGQALFLKGAAHWAEIDAARKHWAFDMTAIPSKTEPEAVILKLGNISRV